jgi:hypothetical protein
MSEDHRAGIQKVREVAQELGTTGQDATPDARDPDVRDSLQEEIRRRQAQGDDKPIADRDAP